jgi:DNA-binding FrmR family transcriptional regulator
MRPLRRLIRVVPSPRIHSCPWSLRVPPWSFRISVVALATYTLWGYIEAMRENIKTSCQKRLSRIEGQVRGLSRMVDEDRYCIDIVTQISAVRAALRRVEEEVLKDHVSHCVEHAITSGDKTDQRRKIAELMAVIERVDR